MIYCLLYKKLPEPDVFCLGIIVLGCVMSQLDFLPPYATSSVDQAVRYHVIYS